MNDKFRKAPYHRFKEFIAARADRYLLLRSLLEELALPQQTLAIAGKRHIAAAPRRTVSPAAGAALVPAKLSPETVIITAHYDRAPDSPGANDNSAAVFILAETLSRNFPPGPKGGGTAEGPGAGPLVIFTDGEELSGSAEITEQGSYSLGLYLKERGAGNVQIYNFDACGSGDTLIISTTAGYLLKTAAETENSDERRLPAERRIHSLRAAALEAARKARLEKTLLLPTPFSDDAGFLKAGLASQTVTVLPGAEAAAFAALIRRRPEILSGLLSSAGILPADRRLIPETWRSLNGPGDSLLRLTPDNWKYIADFAEALLVQVY